MILLVSLLGLIVPAAASHHTCSNPLLVLLMSSGIMHKRTAWCRSCLMQGIWQPALLTSYLLANKDSQDSVSYGASAKRWMSL